MSSLSTALRAVSVRRTDSDCTAGERIARSHPSELGRRLMTPVRSITSDWRISRHPG